VMLIDGDVSESAIEVSTDFLPMVAR
jgi:hypothetical protein